ncbi:achain crystal structure of engineered northeast structural genomics consortium target [Stylonychia lemnae]|uniref:Achain crystal structure of engineered northeast structural genomics consortium target n=1 Tax=Stylonychia lemnae TaxID=5949 RepID=A0A077ZYJ3_STYLE|nr:achain crystal structure of engineered northeast structural genomics consortium target [Stylonychia lemnae]|eukprot:CDW74950.1 achain crystal structure of engineered northeast structural genomics consortium target [Stylonychia lemnae]
MTAMHLICSIVYESKSDQLLEVCLKNGANPNIQDIYGRAPIHMVAASGNIQAIQSLVLKAGDKLQLDLQTIGGETAAHKCVMFCKPECLQILLNAGANPLLLTAEGESVITMAEKCQNAQIIEVLKRWIEKQQQLK